MGGGMGGKTGMGGMGARYVVESTGAASLFSLPDMQREDAQIYSADATDEDRATKDHLEQALGGYGCDAAPCARVKLQELRDANARVGANATAGGVEVPCEFQRASRDSLQAMSLKERTLFLTRLPTLITGLTDEWPARTAWADPQRFSQRFGHHTIKAIRAGHGFARLARLGGPQCTNFDEVGCPGQANATMTLAEVLPFTAGEQVVLMDLEDMNAGEFELLADLTTMYEVPEFLDALSNVRLLSLGGRPEGVQMSRHDSAWLATIAGAKLWHLAPRGVPQPQDRFCPNRGKIDYELAAREGVIHCMANPGEVVVVPDGWWHATCNMMPYTLAVGGQTWESAVGQPFRERSDTAKAEVEARWREGRPRQLNEWQTMIGSAVVEGERVPSSR